MSDLNDGFIKIGNAVEKIKKSIDVSKLNFEVPDFSSYISSINEESNRAFRQIAEARAEEERIIVQREQEKIDLLKSIDKNTSVLPEMYKVLEQSNQYQKEILDFMNELNSLATIKSKLKAQTKYREIMNRIGTVINDVNVITTLYNYGTFVYNTLHSMGKL